MEKNINLEFIGAIDSNDNDKIAKLMKETLNINYQDTRGFTPLIMATIHGNMDVVKWLLSKGADPNVQDLVGLSALHYACRNKQSDIFDKLIESKTINLNIESKKGRTVLLEACESGSTYFIDKLLNFKAVNVDIVDKTGKAAIHYLLEYYDNFINSDSEDEDDEGEKEKDKEKEERDIKEKEGVANTLKHFLRLLSSRAKKKENKLDYIFTINEKIYDPDFVLDLSSKEKIDVISGPVSFYIICGKDRIFYLFGDHHKPSMNLTCEKYGKHNLKRKV
jgi:hypothetical protein